MANLSSEELTYWRAFARRQPIGLAALFRAASMVCSAATAPYRKDGSPPPSAADWMPDWWGDRRRRRRRPSPEDAAAYLNRTLGVTPDG